MGCAFEVMPRLNFNKDRKPIEAFLTSMVHIKSTGPYVPRSNIGVTMYLPTMEKNGSEAWLKVHSIIEIKICKLFKDIFTDVCGVVFHHVTVSGFQHPHVSATFRTPFIPKPLQGCWKISYYPINLTLKLRQPL